MKFDKRYKPELCAGVKDRRFYLNNAHLDVDKARILSADGSALVCIPVELSAGDLAGPISADALKAARKAPTVDRDLEILARDSLIAGGITFPRASADYKYPDVDRLIPRLTQADIAIDARLLLVIQNALGASGVSLQFAKNPDGTIDPHAAILVKPIYTGSTIGGNPNALGALMPMRCS